jgi:DUF971 family protein
MTPPPTDLQLIGREVALHWADGAEDFFPPEFLRTHSPSAENVGERDIFGQQYGGGGSKDFAGVEVKSWKLVGNYGVAFVFSDGHSTGIYTWKLLREWGEKLRGERK